MRAVEQVAQTEDDFVDLGRYYNTHFVFCDMVDPAAQPEVIILFP